MNITVNVLYDDGTILCEYATWKAGERHLHDVGPFLAECLESAQGTRTDEGVAGLDVTVTA